MVDGVVYFGARGFHTSAFKHVSCLGCFVLQFVSRFGIASCTADAGFPWIQCLKRGEDGCAMCMKANAKARSAGKLSHGESGSTFNW